eukprot:5632688-Pleurochrysis_carterae.AAC.3
MHAKVVSSRASGAAACQAAPSGLPPIAFTAELDGSEGFGLNESNPILARSAPRDARGQARHSCAIGVG